MSFETESELELFTRLGRSGKQQDIDLLMEKLEMCEDLATTKLVDFALSLIKSRRGQAHLEYYLFHGTVRQRNYAALYFKRRRRRKLLKQAVEAGCVDDTQAFSK